MPILSQIYVYPVKSLAGFAVSHWPVDKTGLRYDRKWMLIDADGQFLSQRRLPKMALIHTAIGDNQLILSTAGYPDLQLPLAAEGGETIEVSIWKDQCLATASSAQADAWLSTVLDFSCRLVYFPESELRQVDLNYALAGDQTAFSDGFPFLIIAEASLQALNTATALNFEMQRFRPNLVIADCPSYAEDGWREIRIGEITFRLPKPCSRCSVPTIDPATAKTGKEPLTTLSRLRQWQNKVYFGQNAIHVSSGELSVGSSVDILRAGELQPPL